MSPETIDLRARFRFFLERSGAMHGGGGRYAMHLARAEQALEQRNDYRFRWRRDPEPDTTWMPPDMLADYEAGTLKVEIAELWRRCPLRCGTDATGEWAFRQCMAGVVHYGEDNVRRVYEAELAFFEGLGVVTSDDLTEAEPAPPADLDAEVWGRVG